MKRNRIIAAATAFFLLWTLVMPAALADDNGEAEQIIETSEIEAAIEECGDIELSAPGDDQGTVAPASEAVDDEVSAPADEAPGLPSEPSEIPEISQIQDAPSASDVPGASDAPETEETQDVPETPETQETPDDTEDTDDAEAPEAGDAPEDAGAPGAAESPAGPEASDAHESEGAASASAAEGAEASQAEGAEALQAESAGSDGAPADAEGTDAEAQAVEAPDEADAEDIVCEPVDEIPESCEMALEETFAEEAAYDLAVASDAAAMLLGGDDVNGLGSEMQVVYPDGGMSNDEAVSGYIDQWLYGQMDSWAMPMMEAQCLAGSRLTWNSPERRLYDKMSPLIKEVAEGRRGSAEFSFPISEIYDDVAFSAADLGLSSLTWEDDDSEVNFFAAMAFKSRVNADMGLVLNALMADLPYDLYWFDKTHGLWYSNVQYVLEGGRLRIKNYRTGTLRYQFCVAREYSASDAVETFATNQEKCASIKTAADNAMKIVDKYKDKSDIEKLYAYKDEICARVSYNYDAVRKDTDYGNPWQLVWVFDGDDATNVVCEGYSKAFQYLCELGSFQKPVTVISTYGFMGNDRGGGGRHMWNNVTVDDVTYLADLTNSDASNVRVPDQLFMRGYSYKERDIYYFETELGTLHYIYDDKCVRLFSEREIGYSGNAAGPVEAAKDHGECGSLKWTLSKNGILYIEGSGAIPDYTTTVPAPWCATDELRTAVKRVYLGGGVTRIGDYAFCDCVNMTQITVAPETVSFGSDIFKNCHMYAENAKGIVIRGCGNMAARDFAQSMMEAQVAVYSVTHLDIQVDNAVAPTCVKSGLTWGFHCTLCGEVFDEQEVIPATGHKEVADAAVAPTCTQTGLTAGTHCSVCNEKLVKQKVVPAKGHRPVAMAAVAPTQTRTGLTEGSRCSVCKEVLVPQRVVPALGKAADTSSGASSGTPAGGTSGAAAGGSPAGGSPGASAGAPAGGDAGAGAQDVTVHVSKNATEKVSVGSTIHIATDGRAVKSFSSSNRKVAAVSQDGTVIAGKPGTAKITIRLKNKKKITLKVKVEDPYAPKSVRIAQGKTAAMKVGHALDLSVTMKPGTARSGVVWKSSNRRVAVVDGQGRVTAKKPGRARITVVTANGKKSSITIRVSK